MAKVRHDKKWWILLTVSVASVQIALASSGEIELTLTMLVLGALLLVGVPYSFLLAAYTLFIKNHSSGISGTLVATARLTMVFTIFVVAALSLNDWLTGSVGKYIFFGSLLFSGFLVAILGFKLIQFGELAVVIVLLPASLLLLVLLGFFYL